MLTANLLQLWTESAFFRVNFAVFVIGSGLLVAVRVNRAMTTPVVTSDMEDAVQVLENAVSDPAQRLSVAQQHLVRQAISTLTPEQKKQYESLIGKWNRSYPDHAVRD